MNIDEAMKDYETLPRMVRRKIFTKIMFGTGPWINYRPDWDIRFLRRQAREGSGLWKQFAERLQQELQELRK